MRVVALNAFGGSAASNEITTVVGAAPPTSNPQPPDPCPPGAAAPPIPMLLTPTVNGRTVTLTWLPTPGSLLYAVHASSTPTLGEDLLKTTSATTSYQWSNAPVGTLYVHVHAIGLCAGSTPSNEVTLRVSSTVTPPTTPTPIPPGVIACSNVPDVVSCPNNGGIKAPTLGCGDFTWSCASTTQGACSSHDRIRCRVCPGPLCS